MSRVIRRWVLRAVVLAILVALFVVDSRLKTGTVTGFVPQETRWIAYAPRFTRFWGGVLSNGTFRGFIKEWPKPYGDLELAVRRDTGVRPMSLRWSLWMGPRMLSFGTDNGTGFCARPGLLLHGAHFVHTRFSDSGAEGVFHYGPYTYAWRDGFLLFSKSPEIVASALKGPAYSPKGKPARDEILFEWRDTPEFTLFMRPTAGMPVRGEIALHAPASPPSPVVSGVWPRPPFLTLTASDPALASAGAASLRSTVQRLPEWTGLRGLVPSWAGEWPNTLAPQSCAVALVAPEEKANLPGYAEVVRNTSADMPVLPSDDIRPMRAEGPYWLAADTRELLDALTPPREGAGTADAALDIDWAQVGSWFEQFVQARKRQDESLLEPVEVMGAPASRAIAQLGALHITGRAEGGVLRFEGRLCETPSAQETMDDRLSALK